MKVDLKEIHGPTFEISLDGFSCDLNGWVMIDMHHVPCDGKSYQTEIPEVLEDLPCDKGIICSTANNDMYVVYSNNGKLYVRDLGMNRDITKHIQRIVSENIPEQSPATSGRLQNAIMDVAQLKLGYVSDEKIGGSRGVCAAVQEVCSEIKRLVEM